MVRPHSTARGKAAASDLARPSPPRCRFGCWIPQEGGCPGTDAPLCWNRL